MDTSETYIKMCEKAEEIQKLRNTIFKSEKPVGQYPAGKYKLMDTGDVFFQEGMEIQCSFGIAYPNSIWLPRQDQLQEMVDISNHDLISRFTNWYFCLNSWHEYVPCKSMEQLWLAFIMKEKFRKIWNGENWKCIE